MKPAPFAHHRAHSVPEAVALLAGNAVRDAPGLAAGVGQLPLTPGPGPCPAAAQQPEGTE